MCGYELGVISDLQVGEILYSSENVTLSWDSTTVDGHHYNEVHFSICHYSTHFIRNAAGCFTRRNM